MDLGIPPMCDDDKERRAPSSQGKTPFLKSAFHSIGSNSLGFCKRQFFRLLQETIMVSSCHLLLLTMFTLEKTFTLYQLL